MVLAFCWRHLRGKAQHASDEPRAGAALFGRGREKGQDVEERCGVRSTIVDTYVARRQKSVLSHHQICREGWASQAGGRSEGSRGRESSAQGWGPEGGYFGKRIEGGVLDFLARSWSTPRLPRRLVLRQRRQDLLGALLTQVCVLMDASRAGDARGGVYHVDLGVLSSSGRRFWRASAALKRNIV